MSAHAHEVEHPGPAIYVVIAVFLTLLTVMELTVFYVQSLQPLLVPLLIVLAIAKFILVAGFYMHLRYDHRLFSIFFVFPLILGVMIAVSLLMLFEYLSHHLA
jgi:cytochrome c oxidase subunit IV